jgi:hypothetical protein
MNLFARSFEIEHEEEDKKDDNLSELLEDLEVIGTNYPYAFLHR